MNLWYRLNETILDIRKDVNEAWDQDLIRCAKMHTDFMDEYFEANLDSIPTQSMDIEVSTLQLLYSILTIEIKNRGLTQEYLEQVLKNDQ